MVNVSFDALRTGEIYVPGLSSEYVAKKYGVPIGDIAKLASAENPHGASPKAKAAIEAAQGNLDIYPSWTAEHLREAIGERYGFKPENIVCGSGETEVISMVIRAFAAPDQPILMHDPCFPIYRIYTACEGRNAVFAPTGEDFDPMIDNYIELVKKGPRIAFVTNPNNPSGRFLNDEELRKIFDAAPKDTLLVLDEAYIHYTETDGSMHLLKEYDNLIVLRTFSKAFGLAGLRIGFAISANPDLISPLLRIKPTWNMGQLQIIGGAAGVFDTEHVDRAVKTVSEMRKYVTGEMGKMNRFRMVPGSRANFFLAEILDPDLDSTIVFNELLKRGVIVKDGTDIGVGNRYLRVDLNQKRHMDRYLNALREIETQK
ncbi:histidinol-phosphate transaminase [Roseovarius pacificus]|uniref:pyridoxal phosphate-dependent aminotransferase n=1 Tax=Roseovarius pacificus TaxID=337701 RepID=UPI002A18DD29|nr:histidinol-phosphate transaminase [Roseovarius pacificus]